MRKGLREIEVECIYIVDEKFVPSNFSGVYQ